MTSRAAASRTEASPADATVHQRMVAILAELPAIGKDSRNEQQRFMYRGFDDVMAALNPLLARHGVFVVPEVIDRDTAQRATKSGGVMFGVNLHVRYTFYGAAGDSVSASAWGEGTDSGDKSTNKAMTMAFKNVLNQSFAISTREDIDADSQTPEESVSRASSPDATAAAETRKVSAAAKSPPGAADQKNGEHDPPTAEDLAALFKLVEERGGDVAKTMSASDTAQERGKLGNWYSAAVIHWTQQPVMSDFGKKAVDAQVAGEKARAEREQQAQADRDGAKAA